MLSELYLIKRILTVFQSRSCLIVCSGLGIPRECPVLEKLLPSSSTFGFEIYNVKSGLSALMCLLCPCTVYGYLCFVIHTILYVNQR